jgi:ubiquinone/menaquinone biosynthesis C-methylase UbiE
VCALSLRDLDRVEARLTESVSLRMVDLARLRSGMRVLDVGCGAGEPGLLAASRVAPSGVVVGVDRAAASVALASEKAKERAIANVEFEDLPRVGLRFDAALARWSVQSMQAPEAAIEAIHARLEPGAPFVVATWAEPERIPWWSIPRAVVERFTALPPRAANAPGASRFSTREAFEPLLSRAGFRLSAVEEMPVDVFSGDSAAAMTAWARTVFAPWFEQVPASRTEEFQDAMNEAWTAAQGGSWVVGGMAVLFVSHA